MDSNEFSLYKVDQELSADRNLSTVAVLSSVLNAAKLQEVIAAHQVDVIFHAAAHKHVPIVEANVLEGIQNNVLGTRAVAESAYANGVKHFVLISTDKAVRPTNVMGATKRWAELIVQGYAAKATKNGTGQKFCAVRFGNVLGSNGSVVPLFKEQIAHGGPLTLTDPLMTRYFMSIREAAELIVQAGALSDGGDVFLLDMGEPMLIKDLAENMVRLAGLSVRNHDNPQGDIEIVTTGKRPGEKMYEELFYDQASAQRTRHPKIHRAMARDALSVDQTLTQMCSHLRDRDETAAQRLLFEVVRESDRSRTVKSSEKTE